MNRATLKTPLARELMLARGFYEDVKAPEFMVPLSAFKDRPKRNDRVLLVAGAAECEARVVRQEVVVVPNFASWRLAGQEGLAL